MGWAGYCIFVEACWYLLVFVVQFEDAEVVEMNQEREMARLSWRYSILLKVTKYDVKSLLQKDAARKQTCNARWDNIKSFYTINNIDSIEMAQLGLPTPTSALLIRLLILSDAYIDASFFEELLRGTGIVDGLRLGRIRKI